MGVAEINLKSKKTQNIGTEKFESIIWIWKLYQPVKQIKKKIDNGRGVLFGGY